MNATILPLIAAAAAKLTVLLALAAAGSAALRRASAATRHLVWQLALAGALVIPFAASLVRIPVLPAVSSERIAQVEQQTVFVERAARADVDASATPAPRGSDVNEVPRVSEPSVTIAAAPASRWTVAQWAYAIWLSGVAVLIARLLLGGLIVHLHARSARPLYRDGWGELVEELSDEIGLRRPVRLLQGDVAMPITWGVFRRPVVLMPQESATWSVERRRLVLLHELAHVARGDARAQLIAQVACALYWFHPLVWFGAARMRAEAERACDDTVLRAGARASVYADHLLELVRKLGGLRTPALALPMAHRSTFEGRLLAILAPEVTRQPPRRRQALMFGLAFVALVLPLAGLTVASEAQEPAARRTSSADGVPVPRVALPAPAAPAAPLPAEAPVAAAPAEVPAALEEHTQQPASAKLISALVGALGDSNAEVRRAAVQALGRTEDPRSVEALINALRTDTDAEVRQMAAWALGQIEDRRATTPLITALRTDKDVEVRRTAVWALGQIEDPSAVDALVAAMNDNDAEIANASVWALGQIEDPRAVPGLTNALKSANKETRQQAVWALGQIEDRAAVPALVAVLKDSDVEVRQQAAWALGQIEDRSAVAALSAALSDANAEVRETAAWALGQIEDPAAAPALRAALKDANQEVRHNAMWAIAQIDDPAMADTLADLLKDPDPEIRKLAAQSLAGNRYGNPRPRPQPRPRPRPMN